MGKGDRKKIKPIPALEVKQPRRGRRNAPRAASGQFTTEDCRETVLAARAQKMGVGNTKEGRLQMTGAHLCDDVGICIEKVIGAKTREQRDDIAELWKTWNAFCASRWHYRRRILGQTGFPKGMNLQILPERFETDQSHSVDLRTDEERDAHAKQNYALWNGYVADIPSMEYQALLHSAENGHVLILNGSTPNPQGMRLVRAIEELRAVVDAAK